MKGKDHIEAMQTSGLKPGIFLPAFLLAVLLLPCCRKEGQVMQPVIHATLSPQSGNTTHIFIFDVSQSESRSGRGTKVFTRWDWDGDGSWDTPFTRLLVYQHRYYAPGIWKPRLEMTNLEGGSDTLGFSIPVARGYSAPKPLLRVTPASGHIFTEFHLDASGTRDDEDSLDQLTFRWDFEGDGQWDTPFGHSMKINHQYPATGSYIPRFQVRDPGGLISGDQGKIQVTLEDPRLFVSFRCIPDSVTNRTPIIMDASASSDLDFPDTRLYFRWDWNNDRIWDTEWLSEAQTIHIFEEEFFHFVRLEVRSMRSLTNDTVQKVRVYNKNQAPRASFALTTQSGNTLTNFRFDCWSTRDAETATSELFYRYDFNGDGIWDTAFEQSVITLHQFDNPGTYKTLMQVQDAPGEQDTCSRMIYISRGTNRTGIYEDTRGLFYQSYGTVLIGDQWWFTRNMTTRDTVKFYETPVVNNWPAYFYYGDLYTRLELGGLCPPGWRIPSRDDWSKLFANFEEDQLFEALKPGGDSDFGAMFGGMGTGFQPTTAKYQGIENYGYYWSTTKPQGSAATSMWIITFVKPGQKVLQGYEYADGKMFAVRCMKDAN